MRKEDKLIGLREEILTKKSEQIPIEQFQNTTIRPILKYQHTILIVFFSSNVHVQYIVSANYSLLKKQNQLKLFASKQLAFRAQLLGIVTGLFTDAEFEFYLSEKVNLDKRIANMILDRFYSTLV
ncbi:MAG: hypothetical protein NTY55_03670 [Flavobacteriia bacterium]|nr:hypothetical protein [Flavobacteriia bacterium]